MTTDQTRCCNHCGAREDDLTLTLVVQVTGDVVHLRSGLFRCGVMVTDELAK
jgi:hypothetical protein